MAVPKLTRLELQIMTMLWEKGPSAIRDLQEGLKGRPAYTTVQTVVYRLEWKKAVRRTKKVANAHIFEAVISRDKIQHRMIDELLALFGGRALPVMAHLVDSGKLTREEVREAQSFLRERAKKEQSK
jgi:BlaI family transcriptional regulator, penicillinase repressor